MHRITALLLALIFSLPASALDYDATIQQALKARNLGNMVEAERLLRDAYNEVSDKREAAYLLGLVLAFQEKFNESIELIERALDDYPEDTNLRLAYARVLSYQGEYIGALERVNGVLAEQPENTDAVNLAGRINIYRQRHAEASVQFQKVLRLDSENLQAMIGLHDIAVARDDDEAAEHWLQRAESITPDHVDVVARRERTNTAFGPVHQLIVGFGGSDISRRGFANWYDRSVEYRHGRNGENQQYVRVDHAHRFGDHDSFVEAGLVFRNLPLNISVGMGVDEDFLPEWRIDLGTSWILSQADEDTGSLVGRASYRHSRYNSGIVSQLALDLDYYYASVNGWLSPGIIVTRDESSETTTGWRVYAHHQLEQRWRIGLGYIEAPETENNLTTDTRSVHGYILWALADRWTARLDLSHHDREASYERRSARLTMSYHF